MTQRGRRPVRAVTIKTEKNDDEEMTSANAAAKSRRIVTPSKKTVRYSQITNFILSYFHHIKLVAVVKAEETHNLLPQILTKYRIKFTEKLLMTYVNSSTPVVFRTSNLH